MEFPFPSKNKGTILALGAESSGNFSTWKDGRISCSSDFGDLLEEKKWLKYKRNVKDHLAKNKIRPDIILSDLHPDFLTTKLAEELARKYRARHIPVQHHVAHIFSAIGDNFIRNKSYKLKAKSYGIACDGTGFGTDGKIWGGEIFEISCTKYHVSSVRRIGHLESQVLIGGDLAIKEPARMLISILSKFLDKKETYNFTKKYYSENQFELLYSQLQQNFNCQETSSTGRTLDAASILLGFCGNKRNYKHEPIDLLEKNSGKTYPLKPKIEYHKTKNEYILPTTPLFKYLIDNTSKDKKRLAATAQLYIAQGLYKILKAESYKLKPVFFAGGIANNKIISSYLESKGVYTNKTVPRGDAGLSFGQIISYLNQ